MARFELRNSVFSHMVEDAKNGELRAIVFLTPFIERLRKLEIKTVTGYGEVFKFQQVRVLEDITPLGYATKEVEIEGKDDKLMVNNIEFQVNLPIKPRGKFRIWALYDPLERSLYKEPINPLLNFPLAAIIGMEDERGLWGWTLRREELNEHPLIAISQKGSVILDDEFYPAPEHLSGNLENVPAEKVMRANLIKRAFWFGGLFFYNGGKISEYWKKENEFFDFWNKPVILEDKEIRLIELLAENEKVFITYDKNGRWIAKDNHQMMAGDMLLLKEEKGDTAVIWVMFKERTTDIFLRKKFEFYIEEIAGVKVLVKK